MIKLTGPRSFCFRGWPKKSAGTSFVSIPLPDKASLPAAVRRKSKPSGETNHDACAAVRLSFACPAADASAQHLVHQHRIRRMSGSLIRLSIIASELAAV
jgi:hypothetical protein